MVTRMPDAGYATVLSACTWWGEGIRTLLSTRRTGPVVTATWDVAAGMPRLTGGRVLVCVLPETAVPLSNALLTLGRLLDAELSHARLRRIIVLTCLPRDWVWRVLSAVIPGLKVRQANWQFDCLSPSLTPAAFDAVLATSPLPVASAGEVAAGQGSGVRRSLEALSMLPLAAAGNLPAAGTVRGGMRLLGECSLRRLLLWRASCACLPGHVPTEGTYGMWRYRRRHVLAGKSGQAGV